MGNHTVFLVIRRIVVIFMFLACVPFLADASVYQPGETLDPDCAPGSVNCGVATSSFAISDNSNNAYRIRESSNDYININTTNSAEALTFGNASTTPKFIFTGGGNVGIGTTSPSATLHLVSSIAAGIRLDAYGTGSSSTTEIRFQELSANGAQYVGFKSPDAITTSTVYVLPSGDGSSGQVLATNGSGTLSWSTTLSAGTAFVNNGNAFSGLATLGTTDSNALRFIASSTEVARITTAGNFGIGTTTPSSKLYVQGDFVVSATSTLSGPLVQSGGTASLATTTIAGGLNAFTLLGSITGSGSPNISGIGIIAGTNLTISGAATTTGALVLQSSLTQSGGTASLATTTIAGGLTISSGNSSLGTITAGTWNGTAVTDTYVADALTISGGTINNTPIGATTATTGVFTSATTTNFVAINSATLGTTTISSGGITVSNGGATISAGGATITGALSQSGGTASLATTTIAGGLNAYTLLGSITGSGSPNIIGVGQFSGATLSLTGNATSSNLTVTSLTTAGPVITSSSGVISSEAQLALARGGTNANLTASNGGIVYSTATALALLSGTATANQMLLSGASGAPTWSTLTHPATIGAGELLYGSSTNIIGAIATSSNGVLITSSTGIPSISQTLPTAVQDNITRTGTIVSGTWNGGVVGDAYVNDALTISGGTINNSSIGATTASTGIFTSATSTTLVVTGATTLQAGLTQSGGTASLATTTIAGGLNAFTLLGAITGSGSPNITGLGTVAVTNITISGAATTTGALVLQSSLTQSGGAVSLATTTINNTLGVTGATTFSSSLSQSGGTASFATTTIVGGLNAYTLLGAITGSGSPNVTGIGQFSGSTLVISGNATSSTLLVTGATTLQAGLTQSGGTVSLATTSVPRLTISELTNGSILFATSSGQVSQANSSLFWDNSNSRLGIGTSTPAGVLDVVSTGSALFTRTLSTTIGVPQAVVQMGISGGTEQSNSGPSLLFFADNSTPAKAFLSRVSGVWENTTAGSERGGLAFAVRPNNADTNATTEAVRISGLGNLGIGATSKLSRLTAVAKASFSATGTVSKTNGTSTLTGSSTLFTAEVGIGDRITVPGGASETKTVTAITSDTSLTVDSNFANTSSGQTATILPSIFRLEDSSNAVKLVVSDQGNVGIGTTIPSSKLSIVDTAQSATNNPGNAGLKIYSTAIDATNPEFLNIGHDEANNAGYLQSVRSGVGGSWQDLILNPNGGNVGIGTTTPSGILHVYGTTANYFDRIGASHLLVRSGNGTITTPTAIVSGDTLGRISFQGYTGSAWTTNALTGITATAAENWSSTANGGILAFLTTATGATGATERARIDSSGNMGIGTTSPSARLQVRSADNLNTAFIQNTGGGAGTESALRVAMLANSGARNIAQFENSVGTVMIVRDDGKVGIGTTTPAYKLSVNDSGSTVASIFKGSNTGAVGIGSLSGTGFLQGYSNDAASATANLTLQPTAGSVGIGTTSPARQFVVAGGQTEIQVSTQYSQRLCHSGSDGASTQSVILGDCSSGGSDLAEYYGTRDESIEAGDIVSADTGDAGSVETSKGWIKKADIQHPLGLIGIISTAPNDVFGNNFMPNENPRPVALSGRVPVKISLENGPIVVGDPITASSEAGVGMKAIKMGKIVGWALESYDGSAVVVGKDYGKILVFVNLSYFVPSLETQKQSLELSMAKLDSLAISGALSIAGEVDLGEDTVGNALIHVGDQKVSITFTKPYNKKPVVTATPMDQVSGQYWVSDVTHQGFSIVTSEVQSRDIEFSWHSFGALQPKTFTSISAPPTPPSTTVNENISANDEVSASSTPEIEKVATTTESSSTTTDEVSTPPNLNNPPTKDEAVTAEPVTATTTP